jgi:hypothetical protein
MPAPVHRGFSKMLCCVPKANYLSLSMFEVVQKSTRSPSSQAHEDSVCAHLSTQGLILGQICHTN